MSPAKAKEKALMALSVRKLVERGWLTALLGYLAKREELSVRLKYIGDVRLRRTTFRALAILRTTPPTAGQSYLRSWLGSAASLSLRRAPFGW